MEKMKQECKVKKPLKIWQGVLTLLVSAVILFVAAPILLSPFGMYGSSVWGGSGGCPFVPGGSAGGVSA